MPKRKQHPPGIKAKVVLEALKGEQVVAELASGVRVHPTMIHTWKRALLERVSGVFERGGKKAPDRDEKRVKELHATLGELAVANYFCPESSSRGPESEARDDRAATPDPSIGKPCRLLLISRFSFF